KMTSMQIPSELLPADGHFGSGPAKIRPEQFERLSSSARELLGTSHRQAPIKDLVGSIRAGLSELFQAPDGYEIVLGNGGATAFWDAAAFGLIRERSQNLVFGEFSQKFAKSAGAPFLQEPDVIKAEVGQRALPVSRSGIDVYAWPHNETSTGVMAPV